MSHDQYAAEAKERWGNTDAYKESQSRMATYSEEDIKSAQLAMQNATNQMLAAKQAGLSPNSVEAIAGAEAHRLSIHEWWYPCNYEMHTNLALMYIADPRFTEYYESQEVGLAQYVHDAIVANANAHAL